MQRIVSKELNEAYDVLSDANKRAAVRPLRHGSWSGGVDLLRRPAFLVKRSFDGLFPWDGSDDAPCSRGSADAVHVEEVQPHVDWN